MAGCSDAWNAGPMQYVESEALTKDLGQGQSRGKPASRTRSARRWRALRRLAPAYPGSRGLGSDRGGLYLGNLVQEGEGADAKIYRIYEDPSVQRRSRSPSANSATPGRRPAATRSTAGTACTATASRGPATGRRRRFSIRCPAIIARDLQVHLDPQRRKPDRDDLRRTIKYGLHGTSMPAFEPS